MCEECDDWNFLRILTVGRKSRGDIAIWIHRRVCQTERLQLFVQLMGQSELFLGAGKRDLILVRLGIEGRVVQETTH